MPAQCQLPARLLPAGSLAGSGAQLACCKWLQNRLKHTAACELSSSCTKEDGPPHTASARAAQCLLCMQETRAKEAKLDAREQAAAATAQAEEAAAELLQAESADQKAREAAKAKKQRQKQRKQVRGLRCQLSRLQTRADTHTNLQEAKQQQQQQQQQAVSPAVQQAAAASTERAAVADLTPAEPEALADGLAAKVGLQKAEVDAEAAVLQGPWVLLCAARQAGINNVRLGGTVA